MADMETPDLKSEQRAELERLLAAQWEDALAGRAMTQETFERILSLYGRTGSPHIKAKSDLLADWGGA
jgi:hypothetical protein